MKCKCGNTHFYAHQLCYHDVIVDNNGNWLEDEGIYESERPYGPFTCTVCYNKYDELVS